MNEQRLGDLFRDAVGETPPASFGPAEVVAASRRATARRRDALLGGTLFGVVALVVGLLAGGHLMRDETASQAGRQAPPTTLHTLDAPQGVQLPTPRTGSSADAQAGCGRFDSELAAEVTAVLADHGHGDSGPAGEVPGRCPAGSRTVALPVAGGSLYVLLVPPTGRPELSDVLGPDGRREHTVPLPGGRVLVLVTVPAAVGQPGPLAPDVPAIADELAARL